MKRVLLLCCVLVSACSTPDDDAPCVSGQVIACACIGAEGAQGTQTCNAEGAAYGACTGCPVAGSSSSSGGLESTWTALGLQTLHMGTVHVQPDSLMVQTEQGLFRTRDDGVNWTALSEAPSGIQNVVRMGSVLFAAGDDDLCRAWRSDDGGDAWTAGGEVRANGFCEMAWLQSAGASLILEEQGTLYRSRDDGASWTALPGHAAFSGGIRALVVDLVSDDTLCAATVQQGLFRSDDGGASWVPANTGLQNLAVEWLIRDPAHNDVIWGGSPEGLIKTADAASSWRVVEPPERVFGRVALGGDVVYVDAWRSGDGGASWEGLNTRNNGRRMLILAVDPQDSETVYASGPNGQGLFRGDF